MAQKTVIPVETIRFDGLRVIRLTVLSFVFVALMSAYGTNSQPATPASASGTGDVHSRTLISEQ